MIWAAGAMLPVALLSGMSVAQAPAQSSGGAQSGVRTIAVPSGGTIYLGAMAGQLAPQDAMGKVMQRVTALCGDRPQLGKLDKNTSGEILAGFFTVTGKNLDVRAAQAGTWSSAEFIRCAVCGRRPSDFRQGGKFRRDGRSGTVGSAAAVAALRLSGWNRRDWIARGMAAGEYGKGRRLRQRAARREAALWLDPCDYRPHKPAVAGADGE